MPREIDPRDCRHGLADTVIEEIDQIDRRRRRYAALEQTHITLLKQLEALQIGMAEVESCSFWAKELQKIVDKAKAGEV